MKTIEIQLFKFSELSEDAKQKALSSLCTINVEEDWWLFTYEDAEQIGLKINGFDLDRGNSCSGYLTKDFHEVCDLIIANHGEQCDTFKTAQSFRKQYNDLVAKYSDGVKLDTVTEENEYDFDNEADELETEFLNAILEDYKTMLQTDYDYQTSEEAIIETIEANDYDFTEDGERY